MPIAATVVLITGRSMHSNHTRNSANVGTGANSGVGYATAQVIAEAAVNYHIILSGRSLKNTQMALNEISSNANVRGSLSALQLDVTDRVSVEAAAREVERDFGKVDVLINNAGNGE